MKKRITLSVILCLAILVSACGNNTDLSTSSESSETHSETSSQSTSGPASSEPSHPASSQSEVLMQSEQPPVYSEQALENCLAYLQQSLTDEQHGGIYRISDFNGSGLALHGGQDKAGPYILIWTVDEAAIMRVTESYTGQKTEIVNVPAGYALRQLNPVINELQNSEIATNINEMVLGEDNRVLLDVIGKNNQEKVNNFLQSYDNKEAIEIFSSPGDDENSTT